jgi:hypothetical protein
MPTPRPTPGARSPHVLQFALLFGSLLLTGCVTTNRTALVPAHVEKLKSVDAITTIAQPEIAADVDPSNIAMITGGGLIPALIDAAVESNRAKKAEVTITPLRDALIEFNGGETLRTQVSERMQSESEPLLPIRRVLITKPMKPAEVLEQVRDTDADGLLLISADFRLTPAFDRVRVLVHVALYDKAVTAAGGKPIYQNDLATFRALKGGMPRDRAAAIEQWSANKGGPMREALVECFAELADMIKFDVRQGEEANMVPKADRTTTAPPAGRMGLVNGVTMTGAVVRKVDGRVWVRLPTGELSSTR